MPDLHSATPPNYAVLGADRDSCRYRQNNAAGEGPGRTNLMAAPARENLEGLARLLDAETANVPIHQTYPLEHAAAAMNALATPHTQGKLALHVA